jgi:hypothetical protein
VTLTAADWLLVGVGLGQLSAWVMLLLWLHRGKRPE